MAFFIDILDVSYGFDFIQHASQGAVYHVEHRKDIAFVLAVESNVIWQPEWGHLCLLGAHSSELGWQRFAIWAEGCRSNV